MDEIIRLAQGNPGAVNFLVKLMDPKIDFSDFSLIMLKLQRCPTIRGSNMYVLYSDLCEMDLNKVMKLCKNCPDHVLEDACSRQDYSGRELVKEYLS